MKLTHEQATRIASSVLVSDVVAFINEHLTEYKEFLQDEYNSGSLTKKELDYEMKRVNSNLIK